MAPAYDEDTAFERVMQACRAAEAKGWTLRGGRFFRPGRNKTCCPIGAFLIETTGKARLPNDYPQRFCSAIGLPSSATGYFITEIDGPTRWSQSRGSRLGRRVRAALWGEA